MGISIVTLAYHEADSLREFLPKVKEQADRLNTDYEIIVVDGPETADDTPAICAALGACYFNQSEPGFGGAYRKAVKEATKDKFLILDGDGVHDPAMIPQFVEEFNHGFDVVIGSRYIVGGSSRVSKSSRAMSRILCACYRIAMGTSVKDLSDNYRLYSTAALKKLTLTCKNFEVMEEIFFKLMLEKGAAFRVKEIPVTIEEREFGQSTRKLTPFIICFGRQLLKTILMRMTYRSARTQKENEEVAESVLKHVGRLLSGGIGLCLDALIFIGFSRYGGGLLGSLAGCFVALLFSTVINHLFEF